MGHWEFIRYIILSFDRGAVLVFVNYNTVFSMKINKGFIEGIFDHGCENDIINLGENFFRKSGLPF